ncbi:E3 ubiquitin-protein ligase rnf6 [Phtheirospermum japonicum]|uniref:E3 ubiquitin-protein ligase rnf6 n=1 Tax=Phtheirospermum japonicum TaxID=374723 RepID=A0A830CSZ6_9LAMI|nr:E3 ubiquitin-protein ligase rnf6 [Phtheirospermum japonicum]
MFARSRKRGNQLMPPLVGRSSQSACLPYDAIENEMKKMVSTWRWSALFVCVVPPTIGSQVTTLKCGHAFHYHCIAKWLGDNDSCPTCRQQAHDAFIKRQRWT